ncbi:unnamed protein product, partial [Timema podura]|nr:unnamed protein product [Timema podura]
DRPVDKQVFKVTKVTSHPDYDRDKNDIALVELDHEADFDDYVRPACLYVLPKDPTRSAVTTGWGKTTTGEGLASTRLGNKPLLRGSIKPFWLCSSSVATHITCAAGNLGTDGLVPDTTGQLGKTHLGQPSSRLGFDSFFRGTLPGLPDQEHPQEGMPQVLVRAVTTRRHSARIIRPGTSPRQRGVTSCPGQGSWH